MKKELTIAAFNALTKKEKKILVAKDVLAQIKLKRYEALRGTYVEFHDNLGDLHKDIKTNFEDIKTCEVCAIGSVLLSTTKFANILSFKDLSFNIGNFNNSLADFEKISVGKSVKLLQSVFSDTELALMEACFEGLGCNNFTKQRMKFELTNAQKAKCNEFFLANGGSFYINDRWDDDEINENETDSEQILIAIMKNIIKNGAFKP